MAHSYSQLFNLNTTGLRFFTVYGPWGRPDMAMYIILQKKLKVENKYLFITMEKWSVILHLLMILLMESSQP